MIVGTLITVMGGSPFYSPSFPRGGEAALFSLEVTHKMGSSPSLAVSIEHKNEDDTSWAAAGAFTAITALGIASTGSVDARKRQGWVGDSGHSRSCTTRSAGTILVCPMIFRARLAWRFGGRSLGGRPRVPRCRSALAVVTSAN